MMRSTHGYEAGAPKSPRKLHSCRVLEMESFLDRIAKLPHKKLALLATELYERSRAGSGAPKPIAITAMACRFPGDFDTPEAFWSFLEGGGDAIELVHEDRLTVIGGSSTGIAGRGPIWGGFLRQVDGFDPAVFGISAKEAEMMDPQQRLLLEVCWEALENVGTPIDALDSDTGVFIGVSGIDFAMLGLDANIEPNGYMLTGVAHSVIAGRLSYVFGLNGPSTVLDTACAAAASAIHLACQSLRAGECVQAIAGGINLLLIPEMAQMLATLQVMARDGRCKVFSADADGFVRAEGCGVIVLRRLSDAMARREPILGLIRGSAWNQDGKSGGLTAPNGAAQERVIKAALANARLSPDQVSYLEAHGTGTALGDPVELSAIGRVFSTETRERPLVVGSVKSNIGHLEAAAGMASVIKVLLALRHEKIPPHLHATTLNPRIDWATLPVHVPTREIPWPQGPEPRIAGVSAFGISGTNVHLVISEPPTQVESDPFSSRSRTLLTLSAKSREALVALAGRYADVLAHRPEVDIVAFATAANLKRAHFAHRLALIAADPAEVERQLRRFSQGDASSRVRVAFVAGHRPPQIGMLFGDVPPDADQLARLYQAEPAFRAAYDAWLAVNSDRPPGATSAAVGFQFALAELWRAWGIRPVVAAGEGCGEIAATLAAGGLSLLNAAALAASIDAHSEAPSTTTQQLKIPPDRRIARRRGGSGAAAAARLRPDARQDARPWVRERASASGGRPPDRSATIRRAHAARRTRFRPPCGRAGELERCSRRRAAKFRTLAKLPLPAKAPLARGVRQEGRSPARCGRGFEPRLGRRAVSRRVASHGAAARLERPRRGRGLAPKCGRASAPGGGVRRGRLFSTESRRPGSSRRTDRDRRPAAAGPGDPGRQAARYGMALSSAARSRGRRPDRPGPHRARDLLGHRADGAGDRRLCTSPLGGHGRRPADQLDHPPGECSPLGPRACVGDRSAPCACLLR